MDNQMDNPIENLAHNPTIKLQLRWRDDSPNPAVNIAAYRLAHVMLGREEEEADIKLIASVKRLVERSCEQSITDDEARKIIDEGLVTLYIAGI